MNRVNLGLLDKYNKLMGGGEEYLKQYDLDDESIREFRSKIKKVSQEEADRLGRELNDNISWHYDAKISWCLRTYRDTSSSADEEMCKKLLPYILAGANVNYLNSTLTSLFYFNAFKSIILLIKAGININAQSGGNTLLINIILDNRFNSIEFYNIELMKILLLMGASIIYKDECGNDHNAINYAKKFGKEKYSQILEAFMQGKKITSIEDIKHNKKLSKALSEQTPEELLQEAEDKLNEVLGKTLVRKRSK